MCFLNEFSGWPDGVFSCVRLNRELVQERQLEFRAARPSSIQSCEHHLCPRTGPWTSEFSGGLSGSDTVLFLRSFSFLKARALHKQGDSLVAYEFVCICVCSSPNLLSKPFQRRKRHEWMCIHGMTRKIYRDQIIIWRSGAGGRFVSDLYFIYFSAANYKSQFTKVARIPSTSLLGGGFPVSACIPPLTGTLTTTEAAGT